MWTHYDLSLLEPLSPMWTAIHPICPQVLTLFVFRCGGFLPTWCQVIKGSICILPSWQRMGQLGQNVVCARSAICWNCCAATIHRRLLSGLRVNM
jgi:hypothetical protein